jgi:hypothetical protein
VGLVIERWNLASLAPFREEWIGTKTSTQAFDVQAQCLPKLDEEWFDFLVLRGGENLRAQLANPIFHAKHCAAPASDGAVALS